MNQGTQDKRMNQLIAKCWADEDFKQKLVANPVATLKAEGAVLPGGLTIKVFENTDKVFHLVIPAKPTDLSDEELDQVAGGILGNLFGEISGSGGAVQRADGSLDKGQFFKYDIKGNKEG